MIKILNGKRYLAAEGRIYERKISLIRRIDKERTSIRELYLINEDFKKTGVL